MSHDSMVDSLRAAVFDAMRVAEHEHVLLVPIQQRHLAVTLGARVNSQGDWVVSAAANLDKFAPWVATHRASAFGVIVAKVWCDHCQSLTRVASLLLPKGYETVTRRADGTPAWSRNHDAQLIPRLMSYIAGNALHRLRAFNTNYALATNSLWGVVYTHHCEHCATARNEREVTAERYAAIQPTLIGSDAAEVHYFNEPVYLSALDGLDVPVNKAP
jgi:hypothetical protein